MNVFLIILLLLAICIVIGMYFVNRRNQSDQATESGKKIHNLEAELVTVRAELDKNVKIIKQIHANNQFENYAGQIVSQLNQGVIFIDQGRTVRLVNTYAEQFFDISPLGMPFQQALHVRLNGREDYSLFETAFTGKTQILPDNFEIVSPRGKTPINGSIIPLRVDNTNDTIVFIFTDNSQSVARIKDEKAFFSSVAHELRTPLTVIRMTVAFLLKQFDTFNKEQIIEHLRRTDESTERLVKLVNDFLSVSRIEQGRIDVNSKPFDMVKVTAEVVRELAMLVKERKLFINHEPFDGEHRIVIGDSAKSKEVLINLISNAIKYTIQGGITISHQNIGNIFATKITDTGNGIPHDYQTLLFKRYTQVGSARLQSTSKSSGLGLYISKKLAKLMKGDVYLETSEPGKGSTFTFTLPLG